MKEFWDRGGERIIGFLLTVIFVVAVAWVSVVLKLPVISILIVVCVFTVAWLLIFVGDKLQIYQSKFAVWTGKVLIFVGSVVMAAFLIAGIGFGIWAKFSAPPLACAQCD